MRTSRSGLSTWRSVTVYFMVCSVLCSLLLIGCSKNITSLHTNTHKPTLPAFDDLVSPGYLTIGISPNKPPMEFMDPNTHQASGFDVDLIKAIASRMALQVKVLPANLTMLIPGLNAKRYDIVISGMTITDERKLEANFIPYFSLGESLLVQNGNPYAIESLADLCGQSIGVQNGTVEQADIQIASDACKKAGKLAINSIILQGQDAVIQLLATNRAVATYQDSPVADYYLGQNPGRFEVAGSVINAAIVGIAVRKADPLLQTSIQDAFDRVKRGGTYQVLLEKWELTSGAITTRNRHVLFA